MTQPLNISDIIKRGKFRPQIKIIFKAMLILNQSYQWSVRDINKGITSQNPFTYYMFRFLMATEKAIWSLLTLSKRPR